MSPVGIWEQAVGASRGRRANRRATIACLPRVAPSTVVRLLPIAFFILYLNLTVFLFAFGPWQWPVLDRTKLYLFLTFSHFALLLGYYTAAFKTPCRYSGRWPLHRVVFWTMIVSLVILFPTAAFRTGSALPDIAQGLANPGKAYAESMNLRDSNTPIVEYIRMLVGPLLAMAMPLTFFYWRLLTRTMRVFASAVIIGTIALFIAMGTNKAIADTVLLFPSMLVATHFAGLSKIYLRKILVVAAIAIAGFTGFFLFFASTMATRVGSGMSTGYFRAAGIHADFSNFMVKDLPPEMATGVLGLDNYLTAGYYATALSLEKPFEPMFGVGNSFFLTRQAGRITGDPDLWRRSYPARIETDGWDSFALFSSIYPWLASDFSFPGTILVIFFIGRFFSLAWLDTLDGTNPFAVALFAEFVIMIFYFPANNQIFQSGEGISGFVGIFLLWATTRRKYGCSSRTL